MTLRGWLGVKLQVYISIHETWTRNAPFAPPPSPESLTSVAIVFLVGVYFLNNNKTRCSLFKPYKCFQSKGHVETEFNRPCVLLVYCYLDNWTLNFFLCQSTVTLYQDQGHRNEHEHICHANVYRHAKFECHSLNIADILVNSKVQVKQNFKFETQLRPWVKVKVIGLAKVISTFSRTIFIVNLMGIAWTVYEIVEHLLLSWLRFVWLWMKVKVNIIIKWCIPMFETVVVLSVMMMALIVPEELFARDAQTDRQTRTHARTHARTHTQTHTHTHTHTHTPPSPHTTPHRDRQTDAALYVYVNRWQQKKDEGGSRADFRTDLYSLPLKVYVDHCCVRLNIQVWIWE